MVFSSFLFLFLFLPAVSIAYAVSPRFSKNLLLLLASIVFYGWGAPQVLPFLLISCAADFFVAPWLVPGRVPSRTRRLILSAAVAANLVALLYYKYFNFFASEVSRLFVYAGITPVAWTSVILPIGISFFTFHKISYLGDIYRGKVSPARSLVDYCLYILFFPQLIAGPIIRYADVAEQFRARRHSIDDVFEGLVRFCIGLGKKVLVADALGGTVDTIFALDPSRLHSSSAWLGAICYSFQIYFDFSGYSDMAIGLARVFGFSFRENFNQPYQAASFTDFWRRWHISLSTFMREYVYIPLGGNKGSAARTYANLWITFLLSGLWHGAAWNFLIWGAFHGAFLTLDKVGFERALQRAPRIVGVLLTFLSVTIGWVFFRAESLPHALQFLSSMVGASDYNQAADLPRAFLIDNRGVAMLIAAAVITFIPRTFLKMSITRDKLRGEAATLGILRAGGALAMLLTSVAALASRGYTPFLYFRF